MWKVALPALLLAHALFANSLTTISAIVVVRLSSCYVHALWAQCEALPGAQGIDFLLRQQFSGCLVRG